MSQTPDSTQKDSAQKDSNAELSDEHIDALCSSLQLHLPEASEEVRKLRWHAVNQPETPAKVLDHIASRGAHHLVKRVAEHPRCHPETMAQLADHEHFEVRAALADNQNIPIDLQQKLAKDEHPDVRFALAECYHVDQIVLISLLEDENPFVADRAKKTLQRKFGSSSSTLKHPGMTAVNKAAKRMRASG